MVQDSYNIIPVTLAVLLHAMVFGSLFVALELPRSAAPPMQLAIRATLVTEDSLAAPPVVQQAEPEPEPEPVQPDPDEEARRQAEEEKRQDDARLERERLAQIERDRKEAERKTAEDKARREREAEAERERIREELERQRLADIEQQRQDNRLEEERLQRVAQDEIYAADAAEIEAQNSTEAQIYQSQMVRAVQSKWIRPGTAREGLSCLVAVTQLPTGVVTSARVLKCNGDDFVERSIENAVFKASPLPTPSNPLLFLRSFQFEFKYDG